MIGNVVMLLFLAEVVNDYLPPDSGLVKWGGIPIIVLIILLLERRCSAMKKAYVAQKRSLGTAQPAMTEPSKP